MARLSSLSGRVEGSIRVGSPEDIVLNGDATIIGDLLVPGTPFVRTIGSTTYPGTIDGAGSADPSTYTVTLGGGVSLGHVIRRMDAIALSLVSPPTLPTGTRSVVLGKASEVPSDFSTLRDLSLNANTGQITVPGGAYGRFEAKSGSGFTLGAAGANTPAIYSFQSLVLNAGSTLQIVGPVVITLGGDFLPQTNVGVAEHPGWLKLRLASGGLLLDGNVVAYGALEAPNGSLVLRGASKFTGSVAAASLEMNGRTSLHVLVLNHPPIVDLAVPTEGAVLPDNVDVALFASAGDPDGTVARVEFYDGSTRIGAVDEVAADGAVFRAVARLAAGPHVLTARAIDNQGAATDSTRSITIRAGPLSLPVMADFESTEGFLPGPLHGQKGWAASAGVKVVAVPNGESEQEVMVSGGPLPESLIGTFAAADVSPVFIDFLSRPVAGTEPATSVVFATAAARVALVGAPPAAQLHAAQSGASGTVVWQGVGTEVSIDLSGQATGWLRLSVREDYVAKKWDLYAGGRMIAADLAFTSPAFGVFEGFSVVGHPSLAMGLDDFYAGPENPIAADADRDGMHDAWEIAHGLAPTVNDRNADPDADGLSNIQEYVFGTDPAKVDTDGDGLPDKWETTYHTNPLVSDAAVDTDGDGLTNAEEYAIGTDPHAADTDGDGLSDSWERQHGLNPLLMTDALVDSDGDGVSNLTEFQAGTDPQDYYNGVLPATKSLVAADGSLGPDGSLSVWVGRADNQPLANAPVIFRVKSGGHMLAPSPTDAGSNEVTVRSDSNGIARIYVR